MTGARKNDTTKSLISDIKRIPPPLRYTELVPIGLALFAQCCLSFGATVNAMRLRTNGNFSYFLHHDFPDGDRQVGWRRTIIHRRACFVFRFAERYDFVAALNGPINFGRGLWIIHEASLSCSPGR